MSDILPFSDLQRRYSHCSRTDDRTVQVTGCHGVSGHVKSQTRQRPFAHGSTVRPSGRFPSSLDNDLGSNRVGMSADAKVRLIRSLTALCRI